MSDEQAYVSRKDCGCVGIVVMELTHEAPKMVAAAMRRGETIARQTVEDTRAMSLRCDEHKAPAAVKVRKAGGVILPLFDEVPERPAEGRGYPV